MGLTKHKKASAKVCRGPRWKALRLQALDRDGWQCRECGERRRLEVDHVLPVATHPHLSFDLSNLRTLCVRCHARKTRIEVGLGRPNPRRDAWKKLVRETGRNLEHTE